MNKELKESIDEIDRMIEESESIVDSGEYINGRRDALRQTRAVLVRQLLSSY